MDEILARARAAYDLERLLEVDALLREVAVGDDPWVERARREAADAASMYNALSSSNGESFRLSVNSGGIEVRYRPEPTARFASVRVSLDLAASLTLVMTVCNEVDLLSKWMPGFLGFEARTLEQVSRFRQLVWMRVHLPFPFAPREVVFDAMGVDALNREDDPCVLVVVRTPDPVDWPGVELEAPQDRRDGSAVRATVILAGAKVEPVSSDECAFTNVMNVDPVLPFLPGWLFNWVNRRLVWYAFDAFRAKAAKVQKDGLDEDYVARITGPHKPTYDELHRRVAAWEGAAPL